MRQRSVIVTGGTGYLGQAVVRHFVDTGTRVVVPWVAEGEVERLTATLDDPGAVTLLEASVTEAAGVARVVDAAREAGTVDTAVFLVGGFAMGPVDETDPETWERMVALNATSLFQSARQVLPILRENGGGSIVTMAAEPALKRGAPTMGAYAATKAAVVSLTRTLAREGADHGIRANAVAPRIIDTPANREAMPEADTGDWVTPEEIAGVIGFLTSDAARSVTANVLTMSRGSANS